MARKILVVDDSTFMHSMYDMVLRNCGCEILHAMSGRDALDMLGTNPDCALIILDINMPGMNGLEFIEQYRASNLPNPAPIVIASTEGTDEDTRRGLDAGATAYVKKPFQPSDLQAIVNKMLAGDASNSRAAGTSGA
jgi:CheY-like chemotaxis protein